MVVDRNARAAAMFPTEWAAMEATTGKKRSRLRAKLRNQADYLTGLKMLPADASCATCKHRGKYPSDSRSVCDLDSDFHGYQIVALDHRCPRWVLRQKAASMTADTTIPVDLEGIAGDFAALAASWPGNFSVHRGRTREDEPPWGVVLYDGLEELAMGEGETVAEAAVDAMWHVGEIPAAILARAALQPGGR